MSKTIDEYFKDWESNAFGYGYGSGEPYIIPALMDFMGLCKNGAYEHQYDFAELERELTPVIAWLLINILCKLDIIEYGTSPRFGWLTKKGERLKEFLNLRTKEEVIEIVCNYDENYHCCSPDYCNCGEDDEKGIKCLNPFWFN